MEIMAPLTMAEVAQAGLLPPSGKICEVYSMGVVPYPAACDLQRSLVEQRKAGESTDTLLLLEHSPVITLGRNASRQHLLSPPDLLQSEGIEVEETDRGGDVTFHGPGQLVGYPILDLGQIRKDVAWYVGTLEEALIRTAADFGLAAGRKAGLRGVWVGNEKVAAIGVHLSRWVTSHGFALNLNTDLRFYRHIIPCGITGYPVTSFRKLLGKPVVRLPVELSLQEHLGELLGLRMQGVPPERLERRQRCQPMC